MSTITRHLETDNIALPKPALPAKASLAQALKGRHSTRAFSPKSLPLKLISTLLWAGFGVNRANATDRTAPSAHNWQEIAVYAVTSEGAYRYDAKRNLLLRVESEDLRAATGLQDFVAVAPLNLVYVADFARMPDAKPEERDFLAGADAGCIAQNVYLACACLDLSTVVRALIDRRRLASALGLSKTERIILAQSVGFRVTD